ncbi:MAG: asparagine synthase (glutamine-hydrolyzing) [Prevotella sp.]|nr:asparagine synthase (glutamine-hydrolyzing) [Prevotella sp.]
MCGITAIVSRDSRLRNSSLHNALKTLELRGPDEHGVWEDELVSIGHRRLSVMGLTNGRQPISSPCGQIVVACNGELYDYKKLRDEFCNEYPFKTASDSEILIPLYLRHGIEGMMKYLIGEFAFVLYDKRIATLYAVRDRFGIKPLCWYHDKNQTIVASKAKAMMACGITAEWDRISLMQSLSMHYQPTDRTMFANIKQVEPGHILVCKEGTPPGIIKYWDINYPQDTSYIQLTTAEEKEYIDEFHSLLYESVRTRLMSDVPVCCHLSGGLDSSTIAGMMSKMMINEPVHCFTIVFPDTDAEYDEDSLATETVEHIGGVMHRIKISQSQILDNLSDAVYHSEGLAVNGHLSCKYLLNREIRKEGFKVALTGEGADECLAGYPHLRKDIIATLSDSDREELTTRLYETNLAITGTEIAVGNTLDCSAFEHRLGYIPSFLQAKASIGYRMYQFLSDDMLCECRSHDFFHELLDRYDTDHLLRGRHTVNQSLYFWTKLTLCNYILATLGDGCEMASSIEGRLPFLDHRLFEYAARLPMQMKIQSYTNEKYILKEAARPYITSRVYNRQKHPFQSPPLTRFFTTEDYRRLRDDLTSQDFSATGIFDVRKVARLIDSIPSMSILDQTIYEPVVMLMLTIKHMNNRLLR